MRPANVVIFISFALDFLFYILSIFICIKISQVNDFMFGGILLLPFFISVVILFSSTILKIRNIDNRKFYYFSIPIALILLISLLLAFGLLNAR